jgi:hypothetical protein
MSDTFSALYEREVANAFNEELVEAGGDSEAALKAVAARIMDNPDCRDFLLRRAMVQIITNAPRSVGVTDGPARGRRLGA